MKTSRKKSGFRRALAVYCAALALLIAAGLGLLWAYLSAFERSRPERAVEAFVAAQDEAYWRSGAEAAIAAGVGPFDRRDAAPEDYGLALPAEIAWRGAGGTETEKLYALEAGGVGLGSLTLRPGEGLGFGLSAWEAADFTFTPGDPGTLRLLAPEGAAVCINGVAVGEAYVSGAEPLPVELAYGFDAPPAGTLYTVSGLRGPAEPSATGADGAALTAVDAGGGLVALLPAPAHALAFLAPPGAAVTVNGLPAEDLPAEDLSAALGGAEGALLRYACEGLWTEPEAAVTLDGEALAPIALREGVSYVPGSAETPPAAEAAFAEDFVRAYVAFSANLGNDIEENFNALAAYITRGELFQRLYRTKDALLWVNDASVRYESLEIYDYVPLDGGGFLCRAAWKLTNSTYYEQREVSATCTLLAVPGGAYGWLVAGMQLEA